MSERFRLVLLLIVLLYLFVAIKLIHRKRLSLNYSLLWLLMAVVLVVMVVFLLAFVVRLSATLGGVSGRGPPGPSSGGMFPGRYSAVFRISLTAFSARAAALTIIRLSFLSALSQERI